MEYDEHTLIDSKRRLYGALISKHRNRLELSDIEVNLMYTLSKDDDIQKILNAAMPRSKVR
jgi:hypothetical protein